MTEVPTCYSCIYCIDCNAPMNEYQVRRLIYLYVPRIALSSDTLASFSEVKSLNLVFRSIMRHEFQRGFEQKPRIGLAFYTVVVTGVDRGVIGAESAQTEKDNQPGLQGFCSRVVWVMIESPSKLRIILQLARRTSVLQRHIRILF